MSSQHKASFIAYVGAAALAGCMIVDVAHGGGGTVASSPLGTANVGGSTFLGGSLLHQDGPTVLHGQTVGSLPSVPPVLGATPLGGTTSTTASTTSGGQRSAPTAHTPPTRRGGTKDAVNLVSKAIKAPTASHESSTPAKPGTTVSLPGKGNAPGGSSGGNTPSNGHGPGQVVTAITTGQQHVDLHYLHGVTRVGWIPVDVKGGGTSTQGGAPGTRGGGLTTSPVGSSTQGAGTTSEGSGGTTPSDGGVTVTIGGVTVTIGAGHVTLGGALGSPAGSTTSQQGSTTGGGTSTSQGDSTTPSSPGCHQASSGTTASSPSAPSSWPTTPSASASAPSSSSTAPSAAQSVSSTAASAAQGHRGWGSAGWTSTETGFEAGSHGDRSAAQASANPLRDSAKDSAEVGRRADHTAQARSTHDGSHRAGAHRAGAHRAGTHRAGTHRAGAHRKH